MQKAHKLNENRGELNFFVEIGGIFSMHQWLKGVDAPAMIYPFLHVMVIFLNGICLYHNRFFHLT